MTTYIDDYSGWDWWSPVLIEPNVVESVAITWEDDIQTNDDN